MINIIKKLISFSPRQLENETKAGNFILGALSDFKEFITLQKFKNSIPAAYDYSLLADGIKIRCEPNCFKSGTINGKYMINSLDWDSDCFKPNINFNPKCEKISLASFYFAPSLAISKNDASKILKAKKTIGRVKIKKVSFESFNILIGNAPNPKNIVLTHYDSIGKGAIDNASGVATLISLIAEKPEILKSNLFIFAGQEELSFEKPVYWGRGYKVFEKKYHPAMRKAKKIIIIDGVGNGETRVIRDLKLIMQAFPVKNLDHLKNKCFLVTGDFKKLMKIYHSGLDDLTEVRIKFLNQAKSKLEELL